MGFSYTLYQRTFLVDPSPIIKQSTHKNEIQILFCFCDAELFAATWLYHGIFKYLIEVPSGCVYKGLYRKRLPLKLEDWIKGLILTTQVGTFNFACSRQNSRKNICFSSLRTLAQLQHWLFPELSACGEQTISLTNLRNPMSHLL